MTSHDIFEHDLPYLQRRLDEAGISSMFGIDETNNHMLLFLNDSVRCDIQDLVIDLLNSDPATHRNTVELWVSYLMDRTRMSKNEMYDPDELRQRVRTEFAIGNPATDPRYSYARPYPGGLALTLRVAHATTMSRLSDEDLAHIPLSVDELFYYGQQNTDNVPIDYQEQCGPVTCLSTQSAFVSAKAANMPALISRFQIHAPHGLFFMIPAKHLLYVAPVNPTDISQQLLSIVDFIRFPIIAAGEDNPSHALSRDIFYYSPEGTYETITRAQNPAVQELLTNRRIDEATFFSSAEQYLYFSHAFGKRFFSR